MPCARIYQATPGPDDAVFYVPISTRVAIESLAESLEERGAKQVKLNVPDDVKLKLRDSVQQSCDAEPEDFLDDVFELALQKNAVLVNRITDVALVDQETIRAVTATFNEYFEDVFLRERKYVEFMAQKGKTRAGWLM